MKMRILLTLCVCLFVTAPLLAQGPPEFSGPIVVRYDQDGLWWGYVDWKRGYVAFHGVDIKDACAGDPSTEWDVWSIQENLPPADLGLVHQLVKGDDVQTSVWSTAIFDPMYPVWCDGVLDLDPIAEGTADVIVNDNDLLAFDYDHDRANAYSLSAHGVVYDPFDGEPMVLNSGFNCVWKPSKPGSGHCKNKVVLN